jgi:hypothetical protein
MGACAKKQSDLGQVQEDTRHKKRKSNVLICSQALKSYLIPK